MSQAERTSLSQTNAGKATGKAGAYGGSELGSMLGGAVGPPIIGSVVGNLLGEKVGERAINETGIDKKVSEAGDQLAGLIGKRNVDKLGDIAMTSFGYGEREECVCCPCLPASQVLLFITVPFFVFNCYKLSVGLEYQYSCSRTFPSENVNFSSLNLTDNSTEPVHPCEFGYHYLVSSASVWIVFLPFWILALFGTCWRQCCCCCCDPIVLCASLTDLFKRCCCECGKFNLCEFIWYSHCLFHLVWATVGLAWLLGLHIDYKGYDQWEREDWVTPDVIWDSVLASILLDYFFAGSEVFHRVRLHFARNKTDAADIEMIETGQMISEISTNGNK